MSFDFTHVIQDWFNNLPWFEVLSLPPRTTFLSLLRSSFQCGVGRSMTINLTKAQLLSMQLKEPVVFFHVEAYQSWIHQLRQYLFQSVEKRTLLVMMKCCGQIHIGNRMESNCSTVCYCTVLSLFQLFMSSCCVL